MYSMKVAPLFILPLHLALCPIAIAEESQEPPVKASTLKEVVVTAGRIGESKSDVSANISVIDREDLALSPAGNLGELLAEKGIAHIQSYPGALTSVGLRGFRTDTHGNDLQGHVLLLIDGRRAGTGNAVKLLTANIERIEIIRGPGAVQYGSAAMGGVINVITRRGHDTSLSLETGAGSAGEAKGTIGGTMQTGGVDLAAAGTIRTYDDYKTGSGNTFANTGIDKETAGSANIGYTFAEGHRLGLVATVYDADHAGSPGYFSSVDRDDFTDKSNGSMDAQYTGKTASGDFSWMTRAFAGRDRNSWTSPVTSNPSGYDSGLSSTNTSDQLGYQAQLTAALGRHTLTGGFDFVDYQVENSWSPYQTSYRNPALFLLGKLKPTQSLTANLGLREDWFKVEVEKEEGQSESCNHLSPVAGLAWQVSEFMKLRLQYGRGFMVPSADQLAMDANHYGIHVVGNSALEPEQSTTYEGGVDFQWGRIDGNIGYFHTDFRDKIVTTYRTDGAQTWTNLGSATLEGIEAEIGYESERLGDFALLLRPYLSTTLLTHYEDETTGKDLLYTSKTTLSGGLSAELGKRLSGRINVAHYGTQDVEDWQAGNYPPDTVKLEAATITDLVMAYKIAEAKSYGDLQVQAQITNLFDEEYAYVKGYPMPGRGFFVSLRWNYR